MLSHSEQLLLEREVQGLQIMVLAKALFLIIAGSISVMIGFSWLEKVATVLIYGIGLLPLMICWVCIQKRRYLFPVGIGISIIDTLLISSLPIIYYNSIGGDAVSPAYLLKTNAPFTGLFIILLSGLAVRPLYPLIVSIGSTVSFFGMYLYAIQDPRTVMTDQYVDAILGAHVHTGLFYMGISVYPMFGMFTAFFAYRFRKTIGEAVTYEKSSLQLSRYFSPQVAKAITNTDTPVLKPGGTRQQVAVLFSDIRDFTSLSESMSPEEVASLLSEYHSRMVKAIFSAGGTLDKFIGDGIMATFGTPNPGENDAWAAVQAGLQMKRELTSWNQLRTQQNLPAIRQGIGIHYGSVIAGNIGTMDRLEYTVIGDTVNAASRLENACKSLERTFLISEEVQQALPADFVIEPMGEIQVKGKEQPIRIFAIPMKD